MKMSDKYIHAPRGRPKGSRNRVPRREHTSFTIRDLPDSIRNYLTTLAVLQGITVGQALTLCVDEYMAARAPTSNRKSDARLDEIRRLFGVTNHD